MLHPLVTAFRLRTLLFAHVVWLASSLRPSRQMTAQSGTVSVTARSTPLLSSRMPKVFVYDLPSISGHVVLRDDDECEKEEAGSSLETDCLFGNVLNVSEEIGMQVRDVDQFSLGRIMLASLWRHPDRVMRPEDADLFFIPAFRAWGWPKDCAVAGELVQLLPHLNETTASRHFMVSPRVGWHVDVCEHFESMANASLQAERLLASVTKVALEDRESVSQGGWYTDRIPRAANLHSVPYPGLHSALYGDSFTALQRHISQVHTKRAYLVSAVWSIHKYSPTEGKDVRVRLTKMCKADTKRCLHHDLHGLEDPKSGNLVTSTSEARTMAVISAMLNSTFCFETTGDTTSRKGLVDAIVLGCIPVLFSPLQQQLWPWHVADWSSVSLLVSPDEEDVIGFLARVPRRTIRRLRFNMATLAPRLAYSTPGRVAEHEDALATTLRGVWRAAAAPKS